MKCLLKRMLDETEFLSDCGIRSISKYHKEHPYVYKNNGKKFSVDYEPAESETGLFGGNSNWRGPVWFPVNYLLIESLEKFTIITVMISKSNILLIPVNILQYMILQTNFQAGW